MNKNDNFKQRGFPLLAWTADLDSSTCYFQDLRAQQSATYWIHQQLLVLSRQVSLFADFGKVTVGEL